MAYEIIPLNPRTKDITGITFGSLTVIAPVERTNARKIKWLCRCICEAETVVFGSNLMRGYTKSCGCMMFKQARNHGLSCTPEYDVFISMHQRCENPKNPRYEDYGGRGITVCNRWCTFETFIADMKPRPSDGHSLDRIENSKGYSPENCRWATAKHQSRNTRSSRMLTFDGTTMCMVEWSEALGIDYNTLNARINTYGWSVERSLTEPVNLAHRSTRRP